MQNELRRLNELEMLVGKTPMAEITYRFKKAVKKLYVKLEFYNFSGSIKDRMAFNCLKKAYENGSLKPVIAPYLTARIMRTGSSLKISDRLIIERIFCCLMSFIPFT